MNLSCKEAKRFWVELQRFRKDAFATLISKSVEFAAFSTSTPGCTKIANLHVYLATHWMMLVV